MIKTGLMKVESIENNEIIMTMIEIIITTVPMNIIIIIRMKMRTKIGNHVKL